MPRSQQSNRQWEGKALSKGYLSRKPCKVLSPLRITDACPCREEGRFSTLKPITFSLDRYKPGLLVDLIHQQHVKNSVTRMTLGTTATRARAQRSYPCMGRVDVTKYTAPESTAFRALLNEVFGKNGEVRDRTIDRSLGSQVVTSANWHSRSHDTRRASCLLPTTSRVPDLHGFHTHWNNKANNTNNNSINKANNTNNNSINKANNDAINRFSLDVLYT